MSKEDLADLLRKIQDNEALLAREDPPEYAQPACPDQIFANGTGQITVRSFLHHPYQARLVKEGLLEKLVEELRDYPELAGKTLLALVRPRYNQAYMDRPDDSSSKNHFLLEIGWGLPTSAPLDVLLYSDFAVILTYVHLYTLFMIVPVFNSMAKIDPNLVEAARDAGARPWQILCYVIIPLTKTGLALGTIFVVTLVMGDFFVVRVMSGGQSASVVSAMKNEIDQLYYPQASAMAVLLIMVVLLMVSAVLRIVDIRSELAR